ncbi:Emc6 protein [Candida orthopsilosis Co 90-125]|uniref:ER membrane protein complex subunit 6 n=1 Tax=Candida orthopsilosis (strain 90-125) TaxID=1136231 RepID=H8X6R6_CANO9|nr:Emc6 protein [Candida orthopsilosis Co 90-125]CCG23677.1 Emc6 protein [Candida orthopsilosis Co 90-125]
MMDSKKFYSQLSISTNKQKLQYIQDVASLVLGVVAGIITLESLKGFLFFFGGLSLTNAAFYVLCGQGNIHKFFQSPFQEIFVSGVVGNLPGYIMMWCLVYALVKSSS